MYGFQRDASKISEISKNTFFHKIPLVAASEIETCLCLNLHTNNMIQFKISKNSQENTCARVPFYVSASILK